jgi:DNA-binding NarL/FixJ family response regulator
MRVVLVGPLARRQRLRAQLPIGLEIVAEAGSVAEARSLRTEADAYVIAAAANSEEPPLVEMLTARETQVLELVADGLSNKEIGARLGVSDETVKFHLASVLGKLGASNRTDAVRRAIRRGLVPL